MNMEKIEIKIEDGLDKIKKGIDTSLVDDSIEERLEDNFSEILSDGMELGRLFTNCFDIVKINLDNFPDNFKKWMNEHIQFIYDPIIKNLDIYEDGNGFGDWVIVERVKETVNKNRSTIIKFLEVFKKVFIES